MRNVWDPFLNRSLRCYANVFTGGPIHQNSSLAFPWYVWEECSNAWRDQFIWSRYWVSCRCYRNWYCHSDHPPCALEEKVVVEMGEKTLSGIPEELVFGDLGETYEQEGTEAYIEDEGVDAVYGAPSLVISGFESKGFSFSDKFQRKRPKGQTLSEGVADTTRPQQCEFSILQDLPITFQLEIFPGRSYKSVRLVMRRTTKPENDFVGLFSFCVQLSLRNHLLIRISPAPLGLTRRDPS